jgi:hypothetical protein
MTPTPSTRDGRSVGELLLDTELTARRVLLDGPDEDAVAMVRTWPEVVEAAVGLWEALPRTLPPVPATGTYRLEADDVLMGRLHAASGALHRTGRRGPWPGPGPADERLATMADNLARAADLVVQAEPNRPRRPQALADLGAAKARLMHCLYLGSHGVLVALGRHVRDLDAQARARRPPRPGQNVQAARAAYVRVAAFEQLAGSYVAGAYPAALAGEHRPPPSRGRLAHALAGWDVQAHRALAADVRAADLLLIAHTRAVIYAPGHTLRDAAAHAGHLDPAQHQGRRAPAMDAAQAG